MHEDANSESSHPEYQPPESDARDIAHLAARAGISSIPVVGGAGVELFSAIVQPPLERRRNEWMREVGDALRRLEDNHGVNLEELRDNDVFIDAVLTASQIAMRTSQEEKHRALRNAILSAALPHPPEESRQQFFLHLVDIFTVWHIRLLKLFQNPEEWFAENDREWPNISSGGLASILEAAYPELRGERAFYDQIWKDINTYGLTRTEGLHSMMSVNGLKARRASELGNEFLEYIETPLDE